MMLLTLLWAHLGNTKAEYQLGYAYEYGYGISKNYQAAQRWLLTAAEQGSDAAGRAWSRLIMTRSQQWDQLHPRFQAYDWYHLLVAHAQQRDPAAQFQLGLLYQYGQTYASMPQALQWYRQAAASYYPPALLKLGFVYDRGLGVKANQWLARYYLRLGRQYWR